MRLLLIVATLAAMVAHITDACADSENQEPRFCWAGYYLHQNYCPNVVNNSQYKCFLGNAIGCACKTLYRAMDGNCVEEDECEAHAHGGADIMSGTHIKIVKDAAGETSEKMADTPPNQVAVPVNTNYGADATAESKNEEAARQLIKSPDAIELLMMSEESWVHDPCDCLKSTHLADTLKGAERTFHCYAYRPRLIVPHTIANVAGTEQMIKITRDVEVTVGNTGGKTKIYLRPAPRPNGISEADKSLFGLFNEYDVVVAETTCVTLAFGSSVDGKRQCMIWGKRADNKIEDNDCNNSSLPFCDEFAIAVETNNTDPCHSYDERDAIATKKAQKEEGIVM